uniref:Uncharacterized protein n=1 Tax=Macaca fascicularis TaxID=9541 RepID=A0A7N9ICP6_MACFA
MKSQMLIAKTMGKMSPGHVRVLGSSPSHHRPGGLRRKNGFMGQVQGPTAVCSLRTWCPVSQPLQLPAESAGAKVQLRPLLQRVQVPSLVSFQVVLGLQVHKSQKFRFGNLSLDCRVCIEITECPGRSVLQRWSPHGEPLLGQCKGEVWGQNPHTESPLGHCLVELLEEGQCPPDPRMVDPVTAYTMHPKKPGTLNTSP